MQRFFSHRAVMAEALDFEQTSVGLKADLPQCRQVTQPLADGKVTRVVDRGLGPCADLTHVRNLFEVLFDAGVLVIDMQRWNDSVCQHARPEASRRPFCHPPVEDELHHVWPSNVEVLPDDFLKQDATVQWPVQDLSEREFRLKDGDIVAVTGFPVLPGERVWQACQPAAQQTVNMLWSHFLTNGLQPPGVLAGNESVVQRFEADPFPAKLAFGVFMPVQTKFGVVGEVGSELQKERTEVTVQTIPVILIDH